MIKLFNWKIGKKDSIAKNINIQKNTEGADVEKKDDFLAESFPELAQTSFEGETGREILSKDKKKLNLGKQLKQPKKQVPPKNIKFIHMEPFVLHSIKIGKKDISKFIKNKSIASLGDDYYYAYNYANGVLTFISIKSKEHAKGCLSSFSYAFLNSGHYYFNPEKSKKFYFLENKGGFVKLEVGTAEDLKTEHKDLQQLNVKEMMKYPKSMYFEWSLQRSASIALGSSLIVFICSLILSFGITLQQNNYKDAISRSMRALGEIKGTYEKISPIDVVSISKSIVEKTQSSGYVRYIKFDKAGVNQNQKTDKLSYEIIFNQLSLAEAFAKENGVQNDRTSVKVETSNLKIK